MGKRCIFCDSDNTVCNGKQAYSVWDYTENGIELITVESQNYLCKNCGKTWVDPKRDWIIEKLTDRCVEHIARLIFSVGAGNAARLSEVQKCCKKTSVYKIRKYWLERYQKDVLTGYSRLSPVHEIGLMVVYFNGVKCHAICNTEQGYLLDICQISQNVQLFRILDELRKYSVRHVYIDDAVGLALARSMFPDADPVYDKNALPVALRNTLNQNITSSSLSKSKKVEALELTSPDYLGYDGTRQFQAMFRKDNTIVSQYVQYVRAYNECNAWSASEFYQWADETDKLFPDVSAEVKLLEPAVNKSDHNPVSFEYSSLRQSIENNVYQYKGDDFAEMRARLILFTKPETSPIKERQDGVYVVRYITTGYCYHGITATEIDESTSHYNCKTIQEKGLSTD